MYVLGDPFLLCHPLLVLPKNTYNFNVDNVRVVKVLGGNLQQSEVIRGMVIPHDTQGSVKRIKDAKVAVFSNSLQAAETETKGTVLIHSAAELMNYNLGEEKEIERVSTMRWHVLHVYATVRMNARCASMDVRHTCLYLRSTSVDPWYRRLRHQRDRDGRHHR